MPREESKTEEPKAPQSQPRSAAPTAEKAKLPEKPEPGKRTWTRGDDPEAAAEALLAANRGSSGGEYNAVVAKTTPDA